MKRIIAFAGIIILVGLYLLTFISALMSSPQANKLFWASAFSTVVVPVVMFVLLSLHKFVVKGRDELIANATKENENSDPDGTEVK